MEVNFTPDPEKKLNEFVGIREMLDSRYDDLKSGRVKPVEGEAFFERFQQREGERLKRSQQ